MQKAQKPFVFSLIRGLAVGGIETWAVNLATELRKRSRTPVLLSHRNQRCDRSRQISAELHAAGIKVTSLKPACRYGPHETNVTSAAGFLPATFIPEGGSYSEVAEIFREHGPAGRVIAFCHNDLAEYYHRLSFYEPMISRFVAVSRRCAEKLRLVLPAHRHGDILVRPCPSTAPLCIEKSDLSIHRPLRIIVAGRIHYHQKRLQDVFLVARELHRRSVDFTLEIIGEGEDGRRLKSDYDALPFNLQERVIISGAIPQEDLFARFRQADVFLQTSAFEGSSIALQEAMTSGCAPVCSRVSGSEDMIVHGRSGFLFEVGDFSAAADAISLMASDSLLLKEIRIRAAEGLADMSLPAYADWFEQICEEVWREAPRHWPAGRYHVMPPAGLVGRLKYFTYRYTPLYRIIHRCQINFASGIM